VSCHRSARTTGTGRWSRSSPPPHPPELWWGGEGTADFHSGPGRHGPMNVRTNGLFVSLWAVSLGLFKSRWVSLISWSIPSSAAATASCPACRCGASMAGGRGEAFD
jgi:hypothetical protein